MSLLETILSKAMSVGLNVDSVTPTPVNGDCFYNAVIESLSLTNRPYLGAVHVLRYEVVSYVDRNRNSDMVETYLGSIVDSEVTDIENIIQIQYCCGRPVIELFLKAAAEQLNIIILITNENSSTSYPYIEFWPRGYIHCSRSSFTTILLGHFNGHFQSLKLHSE